MRFNLVLSLLFAACSLTLAALPSFAADPEASFHAGVDAFQKKDFAKARTAFATASSEGETPLLLFNIGLTEHRLGKNGLALGIWRKALALKPGYRDANNAVGWVQSKLERSELPHDVEPWEALRTAALVPVALEHYVLASALSLLFGGWLCLRYFGRRRSARLDEKPMPSFPYGTTFLGLLFLAFTFLSFAKALDSQTLRGTIVPKKVEAHSSPDSNSTALFELFEGLEVIIRRTEKIGESEWAQVTYPGGSTGWIPKSDVFTTEDSAAALVLDGAPANEIKEPTSSPTPSAPEAK